MKTEVLLRDVEPGDLPIFFEHQRDPVAVAMVVFRSRDKAEFDEHWAKILADMYKPKSDSVLGTYT